MEICFTCRPNELKNINQVRQNIWDKIEELETAPPPTPSRGGQAPD